MRWDNIRDNLTKGAWVMGIMMSAEIKVDWLARILHRIHEDRKSQLLFEEVATFKTGVKEGEAYLHKWKNLLKHEEASLGKKNPSSTLLTNYKSRSCRDLHLDMDFCCFCLYCSEFSFMIL